MLRPPSFWSIRLTLKNGCVLTTRSEFTLNLWHFSTCQWVYASAYFKSIKVTEKPLNVIYFGGSWPILIKETWTNDWRCRKASTSHFFFIENSSFACFAFFIFVHFAVIFVQSTTWNDLLWTFDDKFPIDHFTVLCLVAWLLNESEAGVVLVVIETSALIFFF